MGAGVGWAVGAVVSRPRLRRPPPNPNRT
jgi:hypothetical protein